MEIKWISTEDAYPEIGVYVIIHVEPPAGRPYRVLGRRQQRVGSDKWWWQTFRNNLPKAHVKRWHPILDL